MSEPFLITGLPRSRTAWLSVAATNDQSICLHEPTIHLDRWEDVFDKVWQGHWSRYVGISDSIMGFHLSEIIERCRPRVLIVERDIHEVEASLRRLGVPPTNYCAMLKAALAYAHPSFLRVPFQSLSDSRIVAHALRHLMPNAWISVERIEQLQRMNIQTDMGLVGKIANERSGDVGSILGTDVAARLEPRPYDVHEAG